MTRLRETQRLEQFFWHGIGIDTKIEDMQRLVSTVENNPWLRKLVNVLGDFRGKRVLDCGCGVRNLSVYLGMRDVYIEGFDISSGMIRAARTNAEENSISGKRNFLCWSFEDLSWRNISFGLVVGSYVLEHVDTKRAISGELRRILKT